MYTLLKYMKYTTIKIHYYCYYYSINWARKIFTSLIVLLSIRKKHEWPHLCMLVEKLPDLPVDQSASG